MLCMTQIDSRRPAAKGGGPAAAAGAAEAAAAALRDAAASPRQRRRRRRLGHLPREARPLLRVVKAASWQCCNTCNPMLSVHAAAGWHHTP